MTLVYGILETWSQGPNVFAKVIAEQKQDGYFYSVNDVSERFPNNGEICIPRSIVPDTYQKYVCGTWKIFHLMESQPENPKFCEYKARYTYSPPPEIIQISVSSDQLSLARERLTEGIHLPYPVLTNPFIELLDGIVVGPIKIRRFDDGLGFVCDADIFNQPLAAWTDRAIFEPIEYSKPGWIPRFFAAKLEPPQHERLLDMAPLKIALSSTLKFASKTGPGTYILNKRHREEIVDRLSSLNVPEYVECRRDTTIKLLQMSEKMGEILDSCIDDVLHYPKVQQELDRLRNDVKEKARDDLVSQEKKLIENIDSLIQKRNYLSTEIDTLESRLVQKKEEIERIINNVENTIDTRVSGIFRKTENLLADIAILRPFLNSTEDVIDNETIVKTASLRPSTFEEMVDILSFNLKGIGMYRSDANILANEITAAIGTGQAVTFQGTMANIITKAVAWSFSCENASKIKVPIGLSSYRPIQKFLQKIRGNGQVSALILEGANNSSLEAYAPDIIDLITERVIGTNSNQPIILASILDGVCSLPSDIFSILGPIFNTDYLGWKRVGDLDIRYAHLTKTNFVDIEEFAVDEEYYDAINSIIDQNPNWLWKTNINNALSVLNSYSDSGITPLQSVFSGWILPRCNSYNLDLSKFQGLVNEGKLDGNDKDKRIIQILNSFDVEVD